MSHNEVLQDLSETTTSHFSNKDHFLIPSMISPVFNNFCHDEFLFSSSFARNLITNIFWVQYNEYLRSIVDTEGSR